MLFLMCKKLPGCGRNKRKIVMEEISQPKNNAENAGQTIIINQEAPKKSNGMGTAGFVLALLGLILCWIPVLDWILWLLGLIFSIIGVFRQPKGLAIAGLVISCLGLIILIVVLGAIGAAVATM